MVEGRGRNCSSCKEQRSAADTIEITGRLVNSQEKVGNCGYNYY